MAPERCRSHPGVNGAALCRECGEAWCADCLVEADELVLPLCRPCAQVAPRAIERLDVEETLHFSPRNIDGWVVVHDPAH